MSALLRYQAAIMARSHRWIVPLIAYGLLVAVGDEGSTPLAQGLDWSGAMLVPVVALLTRSMLTAEPDAARAVTSAAAGPVRTQLAALATALGGGAVLALAGACFEVLTSQSVASVPGPGTLAKVTALGAHPAVLAAGLAIAVVCLLVGSAVGALCNPPLLRHPATTLMSTLAAVLLALVSGISPAAAALKDTGSSGSSGTALAMPHWPGVAPFAGALCFLVITWTASALIAARRDSRMPSAT
jgi:hypothetical protein